MERKFTVTIERGNGVWEYFVWLREDEYRGSLTDNLWYHLDANSDTYNSPLAKVGYTDFKFYAKFLAWRALYRAESLARKQAKNKELEGKSLWEKSTTVKTKD